MGTRKRDRSVHDVAALIGRWGLVASLVGVFYVVCL